MKGQNEHLQSKIIWIHHEKPTQGIAEQTMQNELNSPWINKMRQKSQNEAIKTNLNIEKKEYLRYCPNN